MIFNCHTHLITRCNNLNIYYMATNDYMVFLLITIVKIKYRIIFLKNTTRD